MGKNAPPPPNYSGAAQSQANASNAATSAQTQANRPNINTPFAGQSWTQGPDGQWTMTAGLSGPMAGAAGALGQQAADMYSRPFDLSGVPGLTNGADARNQAIDAAYSQAASRLDPQWAQREDQTRTQLLNQGLTPGSEAYERAMGNLGRERNDAYTSAMRSAIGQGTEAGQALFNQSLAGRQQGVQEALTQYGLPLAQMQGLQSLMQTPGFHEAGRAESPQDLAAAVASGNYGLNAWQAQNQANADLWGGIGNAAGSILQFLPFFLG